MSKINILLIEDTKSIAKKLSYELELSGYSVVGVIDTGEEAIESVSELNPDLILMDITLKGEMTGIEATRHIKKKHNIPVIFLTSHLNDEIISDAISSNAEGYLSKSSSFKEINAAIMMALKNHESSLAQNSIMQGHLSRSVILAETNMRIILVLNAFSRIRDEENKLYKSNDIKSFHYYIVKELMGLTEAMYGALALFNKQGKIDEFITVGISDEQLKYLTGAPQGEGLLDMIYKKNDIVRIDDVDKLTKTTKLPDSHPIIRSLLGSSVIINNEKRAAVYLANKKHHNNNYTDSDELVLSLFIPEIQHTLERSDLLRYLKAERSSLKTQRDAQQRLIQKISKMQDQLIQSEKMASIGQLAAGVAHEINNPIGYVCSNLGSLQRHINNFIEVIDVYERHEDVLKNKPEAINEIIQVKKLVDIDYIKQDVLELLSESNEGIDRVRKIAQDLKDFSHVDESEWQWSNINNGINSTLNIVNNEIKYKAKIVKELGDIPEIKCIASQLNQVFMNLLVNAAHAIETSGVITVKTGIKNNDWVFVEVHDTGAGIKEDDMKNIFNLFFTTKPIGKGTGLGLSLSYSIIKKHCGKIDVQSKEGEGTTFIVYLPIKQSESKQGLD